MTLNWPYLSFQTLEPSIQVILSGRQASQHEVNKGNDTQIACSLCDSRWCVDVHFATFVLGDNLAFPAEDPSMWCEPYAMAMKETV